MQAPSLTIEIGGRVYTARQLTLQEVCNFFDAPPPALAGFEVVDALLLSSEEMAITDLLSMSDASTDDLKSMTEDQLAALAARCKEANPRFFQMRARLAQTGLAVLEAVAMPPQG